MFFELIVAIVAGISSEKRPGENAIQNFPQSVRGLNEKKGYII